MDRSGTEGVENRTSSPPRDVGSPDQYNRPVSKEGLTGASRGIVEDNESPSAQASGRSTPSQRGLRVPSSKFAILKQRFEQVPTADSQPHPLTKDQQSTNTGELFDQKYEYIEEIRRLKDEVEKERELRIAFEERVTSLEEEIEDLSDALEQRDEQWRAEFENRSAAFAADADARIDAAAKEARGRENEVVQLQRQLADLKQTVAASTTLSSEVSDATFRQDIEILQHEVQNWIVNHFRRTRIERTPEELVARLESVAEDNQLALLRPMYEDFDAAAKIAVLQSTLATYLMEIFDEPYLFGLQEQRDWGRRSRQAADALQNALNREDYARWRSITFQMLRKTTSIEEPVDIAVNGMTELICIALEALTDSDHNNDWRTTLGAIVHRVVSLAHLIRVQKCRYRWILPQAHESFDVETMDDIAGDTTVDQERSIRCAAFPALLKEDESDAGGHDGKNVVVKAKVLRYTSET